jgi:glucose-6-phosphate 1-dehydrogenase
LSNSISIFGASGDLTSRKLIPALYGLFRKRRLPQPTRIIGFSRSEFSHAAWRNELKGAAAKYIGKEFDERAWNEFAECIFYQRGDIGSLDDFRQLEAFLNEHEAGGECHRLYYLATAPTLYEQAIAHLGAAGMATESCGSRRIVVEKPFGTDLHSARRLNEKLHEVFRERQIYRIDHYLGKETVQNVFVLRFANSIFEPLWNRNYVDHVQITVAEEVTVGSRAAYYEHSGVLRDMFQNHLLQLMTITAMEAPARYDADFVRDEKVKVLRCIRPLSGAEVARETVRGQYEGYLQEKGVAHNSQTATFAALRLWIDNWRWQGVPFYLRSGKAMSCRTTQIVIQFREPPHMLFGNNQQAFDANRLVIQIQPAEGLQLHFQTKVPDAGMKLQLADLDFNFQHEFAGEMPDAYQRLLLDALKGDASLFARSDEVELAWSIIDPIVAAWQSPAAPPLEIYPRGEWGSRSCDTWMQSRGPQWFDVCPVLH